MQLLVLFLSKLYILLCTPVSLGTLLTRMYCVNLAVRSGNIRMAKLRKNAFLPMRVEAIKRLALCVKTSKNSATLDFFGKSKDNHIIANERYLKKSEK